MQGLNTKRKVYTVTELTKHIRAILEDTFQAVWVEGEISNHTKHSSGHNYFSLKDENGLINCVLFKNIGQNIKFKIEGGLKVVAFGRISVYNKRGQYQLYVDRLEPKGLGALQLAFEQLKERLKKEGLFDQSHKRPIPYLPYRIGIVTSPTGAAIRDILRVTKERFQNVDLVISPVRVQGQGAAQEIAKAIKELNEFGSLDVIIAGRGGGSLEDLWAFNEEIVARAIYNSKVPIISAVGHEVDWTIADFVADMRAPTPSAAAQMVIPKKEDLAERIKNAVSRIKKQPQHMVQQYEQRLDELAKSIRLQIRHITQIKAETLKSIMGKLNSLGPYAVLDRGYSITIKLPNKTTIKDIKSVKLGDRIKTKLRKGSFISKIERIDGGKDNG